ncbi:hypothetical protein CVV65_01775 [Kyrpidia spormannii]|uniref:Uncharacterized protein n=1 Tax=Kyrpidia spormannii TaxID=2055160 RepID=A0A2K8N2X0_9BACL|nr:hypothetical protein CVV65_01775 [Kyrpidia spormannii]
MPTGLDGPICGRGIWQCIMELDQCLVAKNALHARGPVHYQTFTEHFSVPLFLCKSLTEGVLRLLSGTQVSKMWKEERVAW